MEKLPSDKTFVMVLRDKSRIFLDRREFEAVKQAIEKGVEYLEIGARIILRSGILYVIPGHEFNDAERIRQGEWKCRHDYWHQRGEQCGHGLMR